MTAPASLVTCNEQPVDGHQFPPVLKDDQPLDIVDAAEWTRLSEWTIRNALQCARLAGYKVGRRWLTTPADLRTWLQEYRVTARPARRLRRAS